jgi:hypothetical protein
LNSTKKHYIELLALTLTAVLKFIMMDWLQWRGVYIAGICIFWLGYVIIQVKNNRNQLEIWGFRKTGFRQSLVFLLPFIALVTLGCLVFSGFKGSMFFSWHILPVLALYPLWGLIQQFLMLGVISQNLRSLFVTKVNHFVIIIIVSALFSLIHYPSFFLMVVTFFLEMLFITVYFKWKNLWAIGIAHGWVATFLLFYVSERNLWQELFVLN